jgi:hypothetical protein
MTRADLAEIAARIPHATWEEKQSAADLLYDLALMLGLSAELWVPETPLANYGNTKQ